jgi:hypothetical protein
MIKKQYEQIARTFVKAKDGKWYFISTINRTSKVEGNYCFEVPMFAETQVWEWDEENRLQTKIIAEYISNDGCLLKHLAACEQLHKLGYLIKDDA